MSSGKPEEKKQRKCIQCENEQCKDYFKLQCEHFVCPNCVMKLLQLNCFRGIASKESIFIVCNCSTEKNSISLEQLDDLFTKEYGNVELKEKKEQFRLLYENFNLKLKNDYSIKKTLINDLIKELAEMAKLHKKKYEKFQKNAKRIFNLIKYVMSRNIKCDIESVSFESRIKDEFSNILNQVIGLKNRKKDLNIIVNLNNQYEENKEMKIKIYKDAYDIFSAMFPKSRSKKNLLEFKGEDSKMSLINGLIENVKKNMTIIDRKVANYEVLCNKIIKEQGCNNEKKELCVSNFDMNIIDIKKKNNLPLEMSSIEVQYKGISKVIEKHIDKTPIQDYHFNNNLLIQFKGNELSIEGNPSNKSLCITKTINNVLLINTFYIEILQSKIKAKRPSSPKKHLIYYVAPTITFEIIHHKHNKTIIFEQKKNKVKNEKLSINTFTLTFRSNPKKQKLPGRRTQSTKKILTLSPNPIFPTSLNTNSNKKISSTNLYTSPTLQRLEKKYFLKEYKTFTLLFVSKGVGFTIKSESKKESSEDNLIRVSKSIVSAKTASHSSSIEDLSNVRYLTSCLVTEPMNHSKATKSKKRNIEDQCPFDPIAPAVKSSVSPHKIKKYSSFLGIKKPEPVKPSFSIQSSSLSKTNKKMTKSQSFYPNKQQKKSTSKISVTKSPSTFKSPSTKKINPTRSIRYSSGKYSEPTEFILNPEMTSEGIRYMSMISSTEIATCSFNSEIVSVYSITDLDNVLYTLSEHTKQVNIILPLKYSSTPMIVTGSSDSTIVAWNISTRSMINKLTDGSKCEIVSIIEISKNIIASSSFWSVRFWDIEQGTEKFVLLGHSRDIINLININDTVIASASRDSCIKLWDVNKKEEIFTVYSSKSMCPIIQIDKGKFSFTSDDNRIILFNFKTKKEINSLKGHSDLIISITLIPPNKIVSIAKDNKMLIWDIVKYTMLSSFNFNMSDDTSIITSILIFNSLYSYDYEKEGIIIGTRKGTIKKWIYTENNNK